ncbi:hypothetical protein [Natrinema salaciae]|uniref:Uncharacterized protein n=1 Tax=Natrinema salaciae TaxID=1186196 RepID=A0A1H9JNN1_9EURY|nr:hypothetical protein [Natrinema salaciae]SEQ88235.1 hypothetical protein SAMN04489841_2626 [Natrinema salaciae]
MSEDNGKEIEINRRSVLERTGVVSTVALLGTTGATAEDGDSRKRARDGDRIRNEIELDTSSYDDLEEASLTFLERGRRRIVRTRIHSAHDTAAGGTTTDSDPTKISYSVSLAPLGAGIGRTDGYSTDEPDIESIDEGDVVLERNERTTSVDDHFEADTVTGSGSGSGSRDVGTAGLDDPAFDQLGDAVTYLETNSSECGSLCRTNLVIERSCDATCETYDIDDSIGVFETVSGDTCDGEEFGDRFPCHDIPYIYDCDIPDAFDTTWHTDATDYGLASADAAYYNTDFPVIPKTTADHDQETWYDGTTLHVEGTVDHSGTLGFRTAIRTLLKSDAGVVLY